jgi:hypothetical protein
MPTPEEYAIHQARQARAKAEVEESTARTAAAVHVPRGYGPRVIAAVKL